MKKILHIIKSNKGGLDVDIYNLYNKVEQIDSTFIFDQNFFELRNSQEDYKFLKDRKNSFLYNENHFPNLNINFDYILVFGMNDLQVRACFNYLNKDTLLIWKSLGGDIYNPSFMNPKKLYHKDTYKVLKDISFINHSIKSIVSNYLRKYSLSRRFFRRVNYVSPMLSNEMEIIQKEGSFNNASFIYIPLGNNHRLRKRDIMPVSKQATDIYVGSSASPSANHIEVLKKIASINFQHDVHVTLSYKKVRGYQEKVLEAGEKLLGTYFKPQTEFFPKEEFNKMLNNCHTAIFNNDRQEGLFAIGLCLAKEMKVFLSETSYIYKYMKSMGYNVFSFQNEFNKSILDIDKISYGNHIKSESLYEIDEIKAAHDAFNFMESNAEQINIKQTL